MTVTIENNGASLKITEDGGTRFIFKYQIREVEIVRDTIIKIDIGERALDNIYIDQTTVISPMSTSVEVLRDVILSMLQTSVGGSATEQKQLEEIVAITNLQTVVSTLQAKVNSLDDKAFYQPSLIDESSANVVYKGFAAPGANTDKEVWAIQRVTKIKGIYIYQWSGGNRNFDKIWSNRKTLIYS
jgi:hypothetical protein